MLKLSNVHEITLYIIVIMGRLDRTADFQRSQWLSHAKGRAHVTLPNGDWMTLFPYSSTLQCNIRNRLTHCLAHSLHNLGETLSGILLHFSYRLRTFAQIKGKFNNFLTHSVANVAICSYIGIHLS